MYDLALWKHYSVTVFGNLKSCYHKCIKNSLATKEWKACLVYLLVYHCPVLIS